MPVSDVYARFKGLCGPVAVKGRGPVRLHDDMTTPMKGHDMELIDNHRTRTGSDFEYLGHLLGSTSDELPEIPLHEFDPLTIQYSVIGGSADDKAARFAKIAADLRAIAEDQCLKFAEETTSRTSDDKHHRATLVMPQGKVAYSAVWIEAADEEVTDE